ncbi:hypothetical protein [Labrys neptuniae]|uniref:Uncharacterized protein n=1 Tax=Labrys neptuniae TaxID=376174 RepID=A0ABV3PFX0_9HYPH
MHDGGARFAIHLMCTNCLRRKVQTLSVPAVEDAPTCVEELVESQALAQMRFVCHGCESVIGEIVAIKQLYSELA